jgi:recombination protein RecT
MAKKAPVPTRFELEVKGWYSKNQKALLNLAGDRAEVRKILAALSWSVSRNPKLMDCKMESIGDCLMQSAQTGLYPGAMHECSYVPYKGKATFIPEYRGLVRLAWQGGTVSGSPYADVVYENDEFEFEKGTNHYLRHVPFLGDDSERGKPIAVYAVIPCHGGMHFEVKNIDWVKKREKVAPGSSSAESPWKKWWDEQARKTILKYALKGIPKSSRLAVAINSDNAAENPEYQKKEVVDADFSDLVDEVVPSPAQAQIEEPEQRVEIIKQSQAAVASPLSGIGARSRGAQAV